MRSTVEVQHSVGEFNGFRHLTRVTQDNLTPERFRWIWERLSEQEHLFDDFTRGKVEYFIAEFANDVNEFYLMGEAGLVMMSHIIEGGGSRLHYAVWDNTKNLSGRGGPALETFDYLFYKRKVHHVIGMIPDYNHLAVRFANSIGMRFEGEIREDALYHGKYYNTNIYGILDWEYRTRRTRLI